MKTQPIHRLITDADRTEARNLMTSASSEPAYWLGHLSALLADEVTSGNLAEQEARVQYAVFEQLLLGDRRQGVGR